jgi:hypothetical protein
MTQNIEQDDLLAAFRQLREDPPEGLHSRIVQVATAMPQRQAAAQGQGGGFYGWIAALVPDMRVAAAFACTVFAVVGLLGLHVGQLQTAPKADETAMMIYTMIEGDFGWEEWT